MFAWRKAGQIICTETLHFRVGVLSLVHASFQGCKQHHTVKTTQDNLTRYCHCPLMPWQSSQLMTQMPRKVRVQNHPQWEERNPIRPVHSLPQEGPLPFCYQEEGVDLNDSIQTCVCVKLVEPQWNGQQHNGDDVVKHDDPWYAGQTARVHPNPEQICYYVTEHHVGNFGGVIVTQKASNR